LREGREEEARVAFERATRMGANAGAIVDILVKELGRIDVARELAAGDLRLMTRLERLLTKLPSEEARLAELRSEILALVEEACEGPDPSPWMLRRLANHRVSEGRDEEAIGLYRRVLTRAPKDSCRYSLAAALVRLGQVPEARMQLRDLLNVHPDHRAGQDLLRRLSGG